jgi:hypothetical protein
MATSMCGEFLTRTVEKPGQKRSGFLFPHSYHLPRYNPPYRKRPQPEKKRLYQTS